MDYGFVNLCWWWLQYFSCLYKHNTAVINLTRSFILDYRKRMGKVKFVTNIGVNILLVICFVYFFGQDSVRKYLDKGVIITEKIEKKVSPPGNI